MEQNTQMADDQDEKELMEKDASFKIRNKLELISLRSHSSCCHSIRITFFLSF